MKEFIINYTVEIDGELFEHTENREGYDERDIIGQIHYGWYPARVTTISVIEA